MSQKTEKGEVEMMGWVGLNFLANASNAKKMQTAVSSSGIVRFFMPSPRPSFAREIEMGQMLSAQYSHITVKGR